GVFAFKYSPRPNTPATAMADAIAEEEKSRRLAVLLEKQRAIQMDELRRMNGELVEVHVDGRSKKENHWYGHSSCNRVVNFSSAAHDILGQYVAVRVSGCTPNSMLGEQVSAS